MNNTQPYILAFDTSTRVLSVAVCRGETILADFRVNDTLTHSQNLIPLIDTALRSCGIEFEQLDAVAVTNGPGSYTGIRIGVATAKGLLFGRTAPACVPVCTLEAIAWEAQYRLCGVLTGRYLICPALDARRGQLYSAVYLSYCGELTELETPRAIGDGSLTERLADIMREQSCDMPVLFAGDGAEIALAYASERMPYKAELLQTVEPMNCASGACLKAYAMLAAGEACAIEPKKLLPMYLRGV